jgi:enoyl-CoA hydratase/carnithine racemase
MTKVKYVVKDRIAEITLDFAPVNALDSAMIADITAALRRSSADEGVRAVIIASALPKTFCAGIDLDGVLSGKGQHVHELLENLYIDLADAQYSLGKPSIAAIGGSARGGGMTLAISSNMIVAGASATFGYPEINVGLIPAIHYIHLPKIIGRHRAFELLFSGRTFLPDEAVALGLVSRVVPDAKLLDEARALAGIFASKSPTVMRLGHAAFMRHNDYRPDIGHVTETFCNVAATDDAREGLAAFVEKRKPKW